jgi:hypothetical protein
LGIEDTPENREMFGQAAVAVGGTAAAVLANMGIKKVSGKGAWGHVEDIGDRLSGGKSSTQTFNDSRNKSTNNHNNNSGHATPDKSFKHNNTPSSDSNSHNYSTIDEVTPNLEIGFFEYVLCSYLGGLCKT